MVWEVEVEHKQLDGLRVWSVEEVAGSESVGV